MAIEPTTSSSLSSPDPIQGFSPAGQLMHLICGAWTTQALHVVAELGIADHLSRTPRPVEEIAQAVGAHPGALYRVLRALASIGVFAETSPQAFALTPMAALLKGDLPGNLRGMARMQGDDWHWRAWGQVMDSVRTGRPATHAALGAEHCFAYLASHPDAAVRFNDAMSGYAARVHAAVVDVYDFSGCRLIVDVGGGHGTLLASILASQADAHGILFDVPEVVAKANAVLAAYGVADRCRTIGGDFFSVVPAGGDTYVLSTVIHDWDDERAIAILRRVGAAMQPHGRVLIVEQVVPADAEPHPSKWIDLEMLVVSGGEERTEAQYVALLERAGLRLSRLVPTAAQVSIIEARRA